MIAIEKENIKKHLFLIFLSSLVLHSCASNKLLNFKSANSNIVYRSCLNVIKIDSTINIEDFSLTNGKLSKIGKSTFSIVVDTAYSTTLMIKEKEKRKPKKIEFRVLTMPEPELRFWTDGKGNLNDITLQEFKSLRGIYVTIQNFSTDCIFKIVNIHVKKIRNTIEEDYNFKNPKNSDFVRLKFNAEKGDVYIFSDIEIEIEQTKKIITGKNITIYLK